MIIEITEKELKLLIRLLRNETHELGGYDWFNFIDDRDGNGGRMLPKLQEKLLAPNIKTIKIIDNPPFIGKEQFKAFPLSSELSHQDLVDIRIKAISIVGKALGRSITVHSITKEGIFYSLGEQPKKEWEKTNE